MTFTLCLKNVSNDVLKASLLCHKLLHRRRTSYPVTTAPGRLKVRLKRCCCCTLIGPINAIRAAHEWELIMVKIMSGKVAKPLYPTLCDIFTPNIPYCYSESHRQTGERCPSEFPKYKRFSLGYSAALTNKNSEQTELGLLWMLVVKKSGEIKVSSNIPLTTRPEKISGYIATSYLLF